jgi:MOSC domain-containing protein YiiM
MSCRSQERWIGVRPGRREALTGLQEVMAEADRGLAGDHYSKRGGKRQVTLIQSEHLQALGSLIGSPQIEPGIVRRNIVVSGINLLALKGKQFRIGEAVLAFTGLCHPCSLMETVLGPGGYNAMRGHGGIKAAVVSSGVIRVEDLVAALPDQELILSETAHADY